MSDAPSEAPAGLMGYFAKQRRLYPRRVWGKYRKIKWAAMILLLGIYYLAPWIRWDRGSNAPDQAILIDMEHRRGYFFMIEIWPQEVYYLTGILIMAAIGLFFATSLLGRVWCGYACPQTVWTDLFIWVERLIQGDRNNRMKLDQSPLSLEKIWKKTATHAVWLLISLLTGGAWVFYFSDAPTLMDNILHLDIPWSVGGWILGLTFSTYLMAGYAREQVCTYMCPYARFQSAMFDRDTLIITYDAERGEPRGKHKKGESWDKRGHCIDCDSCVVVCPMGIDIRQGLQYQCISCGLCVDACNNVMDKLELPRGLIRYDTENNQIARAEAKSSGTSFREKLNIFRPRSIYYTAILAVVGSLMLYGLVTRHPLELHVQHDRNPLFITLSDGTIRNRYTIKILNKTHEDREYRVSFINPTLAVTSLKLQGVENLSPERLPVFADSVGHFRIMLEATKDPRQPRQEISFRVEDLATGESDVVETIFISE